MRLTFDLEPKDPVMRSALLLTSLFCLLMPWSGHAQAPESDKLDACFEGCETTCGPDDEACFEACMGKCVDEDMKVFCKDMCTETCDAGDPECFKECEGMCLDTQTLDPATEQCLEDCETQLGQEESPELTACSDVCLEAHHATFCKGMCAEVCVDEPEGCTADCEKTCNDPLEEP